MMPFIKIMNKELPMYSLMILLGIFISTTLAILRAKRHQKNIQEDIIFATMIICVSGFIGAKMLYIITIIPNLIKYRNNINWNYHTIYTLLTSGFVFYGGLITGAISLIWYTRKYNIDTLEFADFIIPFIPLAHMFGRIGCFFAGCCYGIESEYGIVFTNSIVAPNGIKLFPVQLIEAFINLIIFLVLLAYTRIPRKKGNAIYIYVILYSVVRFILEFYRYDSERGLILGLSTSQYISIILFVITLIFFTKKNYITLVNNEITSKE